MSHRRTSTKAPPPTWRAASVSKKQHSSPSVSVIFAEPQSAPSAATAAATLAPRLPKRQSSRDSHMSIDALSTKKTRRDSNVSYDVGSSTLVANGDANQAVTVAEESEPIVEGTALVPEQVPSASTTAVVETIVAETSEPTELVPPPPPPVATRSGWFSLGRSAKRTVDIKALADDAPNEPATPSIVEPRPVTPTEPNPTNTAPAPTVILSSRSSSSPTKSSVNPIQIASQTPASTLSTSSSPARSTWFGPRKPPSNPDLTQLSTRPPTPPEPQSKKQAEPSALEVESIPSALPAPIRAPTPPQDSAASPQGLIPEVQGSKKRSSGWFASRPAPTPLPVTAYSIDDQVPKVSPPSQTPVTPSTPPALVPASTPQNPNPATLNASTLRYTLSIPLLGRPKVPLEAALAQAESAQAVQPPAQEMPKVATVEAPTPPPEPAVQTSQPPLPTSPATSSWWSYVGMGSSGTPAPPPVISEPESVPVSVPVQPDSVHVPAPSAETEEPPVLTVPPKPPSVFSAETGQTRGSWLNPWSWYAPPTPQTQAETCQAKTQAELVKEEALARPEPPTPPPAPEPEPVSPLVTSVPENRASWISFFSARAAANKMIKERGEGEVMEVMDLEDDPDAPVPPKTASTSSLPLPKDQAKKGPNSLPPSPPKPTADKVKPAPPLTNSDSIRKKGAATPTKRTASPAPSKKSALLASPPPPNLLLPTFGDTFYTLPRSHPPPINSTIRKTINLVSGFLWAKEEKKSELAEYQRRHEIVGVPGKVAKDVGLDLPRSWEVLGEDNSDILRGCRRVVVIGIHGWFPGAIMRTVLGEPTGTSPKFAAMMEAAVQEFVDKNNAKLEKLTKIALEGEGTIERRVDKLYQEYKSRPEWVEDLQNADAIFIATHSQGSIVSTQLLDRLIQEGHIRTSRNMDAVARTTAAVASGVVGLPVHQSIRPPQRVCCLALCGIHLGPLLYLNTSSLVQPYIQYFESAAARELFEFQETESEVSKKYVASLQNVLDHGIKFVYIASLNDQVVPIYSGTFTAVDHPLILRGLYIDGDAYSSTDFLSNLLVLLLRIRNAGLDDGGLLTHLSEATAGSLSGVGHSSAYLDSGSYALAVRFLFETSGCLGESAEFKFEPFTARASRNDYEIPWALRGLIADPRVNELFAKEIAELRAAFDDWQPRTSILRDIRRKLEPIRMRSRFEGTIKSSKL